MQTPTLNPRPDRVPPIVVSYDEILADLLYPVAPERVR